MPWSTGKHPGSTRASRKRRAQVLRLHPICYLQYPGCTRQATEDEHVVPLHQGGSDHLDNHNGACHHCHSVKTRREAQAAKPTRRRQPEQHPALHAVTRVGGGPLGPR